MAETIQPLYSNTQMIILYSVNKVSALASMVGSALIFGAVQTSLHRRNNNNGRPQQKTSTVFSRIMIGLSCADVFFDAGFLLLSPWAIPSEYSNEILGAAGNRATCNLSACTLAALLSTQIYSAFLTVYYLLSVQYTREATRLWSKRLQILEVAVHLVAIALPILVSIFAIVNDYFRPLYIVPGMCWINETPRNCENNPDIECDNPNSHVFQAMTSTAPTGFAWAVIILSMAFLVFRVRTMEIRAKQRLEQGQPSLSDPSLLDDNDGGNDSQARAAVPERMRRRSLSRFSFSRSRKEATDSLILTTQASRKARWYGSAFAITNFSPLVAIFLPYPETFEHRTKMFVVGLAIMSFLPLQGVYNAIVFFHDRPQFFEEGQICHWIRRLCAGRGCSNLSSPSVSGAADMSPQISRLSAASVEYSTDGDRVDPLVADAMVERDDPSLAMSPTAMRESPEDAS